MSVDTSRETVDGLALCLWDRDYEAEAATLRALLPEPPISEEITK